MNIDENFGISVPFPPQRNIIQELVPPVSRNLNLKSPNSFFIYRRELVKELKSKNITLDWQRVSFLASKLWKKEPDYVRAYYKNLSSKVRLQFNMIRGLLFPQISDNTMPIQDTSSPLRQGTTSTSSSSFSAEASSFDLNTIPIQGTSSYLQHGTPSSASFSAVASSNSFDLSETNFFGNNYTENLCTSPGPLQQETALRNESLASSIPLQNPQPNFITSEECNQQLVQILTHHNQFLTHRNQILEQRVQFLTHHIQTLKQQQKRSMSLN